MLCVTLHIRRIVAYSIFEHKSIAKHRQHGFLLPYFSLVQTDRPGKHVAATRCCQGFRSSPKGGRAYILT